jgi:hypothetical protein
MKQIFDWLREQIEAKAFRQGFSNDVLVKVEEVGNVIDEAEAKWESEVCEWRCGEVMLKSPHKNSKFTCTKDGDFKYTFCPDCGKPIKISEVD